MEPFFVKSALALLECLLWVIDKLWPEVFGPSVRKLVLRPWSRLSGRIRTTPDKGVQRYITNFLGAARAPDWDPQLTEPGRIRKSLVRLGERSETGVSDVAEDTGEGTACRAMRTQGVVDLLDEVLFRAGVSRHTGHMRPRFVFLGPPAIGKSVLMLQLVQLLAERALLDRELPPPVYVNLRHFVSEYYALSDNGLDELVSASVARGCPRYLEEQPPNPDEGAALLGQLPRLLYVFDGIDEMPVTDDLADEHNAKLRALAKFIKDRPGHIFLVTCRVSDYLRIQDYNQDFEMVRYELLSWTRPMLEGYLNSRRHENPEGLAAIRQTLRHLDDAGVGGQFSRSPLLAALVFGGARTAAPTTLSEVWRGFVVSRLKGAGATDLQIKNMESLLADFAYRQTGNPAGCHTLEAWVLAFACKAGLMARAQPSPEFTIKPLQHYFVAQRLWTRIRSEPAEALRIEVTHTKMRVTIVLLAELAAEDPLFSSYLSELLRIADSSYNVARRFELVAACLRPGQLERTPAVHRALIDALEKVLSAGRAGEFDVCLSGIENAPQIICTPQLRVLDLLLHTLTAGPLEQRRRLFQVLISRASIAWRFRWTVLAFLRSFDREARLGLELVHLFDRVAERRGGAWRALRWVFRVVRWSATGVYLYAAYFISLTMAHLALSRLAPVIGLAWNGAGDMPLVPPSFADGATRSVLLAGVTILPWHILRRSARAQQRSSSAVTRGIWLLTAGGVTRLALLVPVVSVSVLTMISSSVEFLIFATFVIFPLAGVVGSLLVLTKPEPSPSVPSEPPTRPRGSAPVPGAVRPPSSDGLTLAILETLKEDIEEAARAASKRSRWAALVLWGLLTVAAFVLLAVYRLERVTLLLVCLSVLAMGLKRYLYDPYRAYRRTIRELDPQLGKSFRRDPERALDEVFRQILNPSIPTMLRKHYVRALATRVRWDGDLIARFEQTSAQSGLPPDLQRFMDVIVVRKRIEIDFSTNPEM